MSTIPNPPVPQQPTPQPQTAAEIAAANAASQSTPTPGQPPAPQATPAPQQNAPVQPTPENPAVVSDLGNGQFEIKYLTGEVFKGTAQEVIAKQAQAHVSTKLWAQTEIAKASAPPAPAVQTPPLFSDPAEAAAAEYAAGLVAKTLGYRTADEMRAALGHISENSVDYASQTVALQFQAAQPDFNPTPQNSELLLSEITKAIPDEQFAAMNREQQVHLMRQAHSFLIQTGAYQAKPTGAQPIRAPQPPPPAPGGRTPASDTGNLPTELVATLNDSPQEIKRKWDEAKRLGYVRD